MNVRNRAKIPLVSLEIIQLSPPNISVINQYFVRNLSSQRYSIIYITPDVDHSSDIHLFILALNYPKINTFKIN